MPQARGSSIANSWRYQKLPRAKCTSRVSLFEMPVVHNRGHRAVVHFPVLLAVEDLGSALATKQYQLILQTGPHENMVKHERLALSAPTSRY